MPFPGSVGPLPGFGATAARDPSSRVLWKLNPCLLNIIEDHDTILGSLKEYVEINSDTACSAMIWDSMKAFFLGHLITKVNTLKKHLRQCESDLSQAASAAVQNYILDTSPSNHGLVP